MSRAIRQCAGIGVSLFVSALSGVQAQTREIRLSPPNATLSAGFSEIVAVRELSDGRVLIGDRRENRIVVADFGGDSVVPTASAGVGPGEHTRVSAIWPLGADSSLMVDVTARRWHIFVGTRSRGSFHLLPCERNRGGDRHRALIGDTRAELGQHRWPSGQNPARVPAIPPFQKGGLIAAPNGNLLVARTPSADAPETRYDEVDRQGQLVRQILLAPQERIVGIGPRSIYVAATDEVGLQHVRRHDWP